MSDSPLGRDLRGLLRELGFFIPVGARQVVPQVWALVTDADSGLPEALRPVLAEAAREIGELEGRIQQVERQLERLARESAVVTRLRTIPGVGLLTATALVAFVGDVVRFPSGRHLASYLGLTPRERSSGLQRRLGRISKRGDPYLRMLLIHGARSVICHAKRTASPTGCAAGRSGASRRAATTRPPSHWPTSSRASSGRCGAAGTSTRRCDSFPTRDNVFRGGCSEHTALKAHRSDRRRAMPITSLASRGPLSAIGTPRATFHHGPEPSAPRKRPEIRLQSSRRDRRAEKKQQQGGRSEEKKNQLVGGVQIRLVRPLARYPTPSITQRLS